MLKVDIGKMGLGHQARNSVSDVDDQAAETVLVNDQLLDHAGYHSTHGDILDPQEWLVKDLLLKGEEEHAVEVVVSNHAAGVDGADLVRAAALEQAVDLAVLDPGDVNKSRNAIDADVNVQANAWLDPLDFALLHNSRVGENLGWQSAIGILAGRLWLQGEHVRQHRDAQLGHLRIGEGANDPRLDARAHLELVHQVHAVGSGARVNQVGSHVQVTHDLANDTVDGDLGHQNIGGGTREERADGGRLGGAVLG